MAVLVALGAALSCTATASHAASSRICRQLETDLAATYGPKTSSAQGRKQDAAIGRQREQLQLARKQSRRSGCGFSFLGRGDAKCAKLNVKIEKMERNLDALQRKRSQPARGGSAGTSRAKLLAAIDANGCRDDTVAERRLPRGLDGGRNLLNQIFGGPIRSGRASEDEVPGGAVFGRRDTDNNLRVLKPREGRWVNEGGHIRFVAPPGNYRTLCVRTCDGYYFPMSNASSPMDFDRDQKNCEASCPGADIQLYYHRARGEESEDMISPGSGTPYSELPTAYLYKQVGVPRPTNCGCNKPQDYSVTAGRPPLSGPSGDDPASGPSSIITLGTATPGSKTAIAPVPAIGPERDETAADRKVRAVGPTFLPDPKSAIDLQAPARTQVQ